MNQPSNNKSSVAQLQFMNITENDAYKEKLIAFVNPKS